MRLALIPSPYVGPASWSFVASRLEDGLAVDYGALSGPDWFDGPARRIAAQMDDAPWIAVLHSSAGPFAPSLAALSAKLKGLVFVDAVLPHPGKSAAEKAPPTQIDRLRRITSDGLLPRWDSWFPKAVIESWAPDHQARSAFLADIPQAPFAFVEAVAPRHSEWEQLPAAYIRLSEGFEPNAARAEELGWKVQRLDSNHLGMVSRPDQLVAALLAARADILG